MGDYTQYEETIKRITGLKTSPVAVKFIENLHEFAPWPEAKGHRFCQIVMRARHGAELILTPESISCPAAAAALGFKPLPNKLETGAMLRGMSIFQEARKGALTVNSMRRLELGKYAAVAVSPLGKARFEPDVIIVEGETENLMWLALAYINEVGGRLDLSTGVLQAVCVDSAVLPFVLKRLNMNFGCYGCREATDIGPGEALLGFPGEVLPVIVRNLEFLEQQTIPRCRAKGVYHSLRDRLGGETAGEEASCHNW